MDSAVGLFSSEQADFLAEYHGYLLQDHDIDYRVVTVADAGDLSLYSINAFAELGVGTESLSGRGLLLVIDAGNDLIRLEVSRSLEGIFTDAFVTYIQQRQMVPFFRDDRLAEGILATTELIYSEAQNAERNAGFDLLAQEPGALGAGAATRARIGDSGNRVELQGADVAAGNSPETTVSAYLDAMAERNANPALSLFTPATRAMLEEWTTTPAQMDALARTYRTCRAQPVKLNAAEDLAVIRYPRGQRECAPWFLKKQRQQWQLDLTMLQRAVLFGRSNAWHFDLSVEHPYQFAFEDWRFDGNGFPVN
jgi:uncharacterized protein